MASLGFLTTRSRSCGLFLVRIKRTKHTDLRKHYPQELCCYEPKKVGSFAVITLTSREIPALLLGPPFPLTYVLRFFPYGLQYLGKSMLVVR